MNIYIYSKNFYTKYNNINIIKICFQKKSFQIMKNHTPIIGEVDFLIFYKNNKKIKIYLNNSYYIQKKNILKIICDKYEFF